MALRVCEEPLASLLPEVEDLVRAHWDECRAHRPTGLNPNWRGLLHFSSRGLYRVLTLRTAGGQLVGYLSFFLTISSHTSNACANFDSFFVAPEWRSGRGAVKLLRAAEALATSLGVVEIYSSNPMTASPALNKLMTKFGYAPISVTVYKTLQLPAPAIPTTPTSEVPTHGHP